DELEAAHERAPRDGDAPDDGVARMLADALDDRAAGERRLGEVLAAGRRGTQGLRHIEGAEGHYARLVALEPGGARSCPGLDPPHLKLDMNNPGDARAARDAARVTLGKLGELAADKEYQIDLAKVHAASGRILLAEGRPADALDEFEAARKVLAEQVLAGGDD